MKTDINWSSTSRRFTTGEMPQVMGKSRGTGRMIGTPARKFDSTSLSLVVAWSVFAFAMFVATNGFFAILWLLAIGPCTLALFGMFASMGGLGCQRLVAAIFVICVGLLIFAVGAGS